MRYIYIYIILCKCKDVTFRILGQNTSHDSAVTWSGCCWCLPLGLGTLWGQGTIHAGGICEFPHRRGMGCWMLDVDEQVLETIFSFWSWWLWRCFDLQIDQHVLQGEAKSAHEPSEVATICGAPVRNWHRECLRNFSRRFLFCWTGLVK